MSHSQSSRRQLAEPALPVACYDVTFEAQESLILPRCLGSFWRSVLGNELHALSTGKGPSPMDCGSIPRAELYRYMFETPPPADASKMRNYPNAPHPFVMTADWRQEPTSIASGTTFGFQFTLLGRGSDALPAFVDAFKNAGKSGAGGMGGRARLVNVVRAQLAISDTADGVVAPLSPGRVTVHLESPLQLLVQIPNAAVGASEKNGGTRRAVLMPREFKAHHFFSSLVRRISMLMTFHTDTDLDDSLFVQLKSFGQAVAIEASRLEFSKDTRWSARQSTDINLSGLVGEFTLDMQECAMLWPYLWLGQWVHAGKHASEGLGAYRLSSA